MKRSLFLLVWLAACTDPKDRDLILLKNPETGQTQECRVHAVTIKMYTDVENCAKAYEAAGYKRVSDYKN